MSAAKRRKNPPTKKHPPHAFRRAVWRGLGIVLPPVLTIVIFLWVFSTVQMYVLNPVSNGVRDVVAWAVSDIRVELPDRQPVKLADGHEESGVVFQSDGQEYRLMADGKYVPQVIYTEVSQALEPELPPRTSTRLYQTWVEVEYLRPYIVIPLFGAVFFVLMYLLGTFLAAGIGRVFWNLFEQGVNRLPLVRNVYSSVKQVTDFMFTDTNIEYTRVVAIQYPRKGIWSLGLVTGEGMLEISAAAKEPVLSILIPSSPMPVTGYTITVPKSETVDLNITIDQALQFVVSCGVVVPPHQMVSEFSPSPQLPDRVNPGSADSSVQRPRKSTPALPASSGE